MHLTSTPKKIEKLWVLWDIYFQRAIDPQKQILLQMG